MVWVFSSNISSFCYCIAAFTSHQENTSDALFDNVNHIIHQRRAESLQPHKYTETSAEASASTTLQQPSPATSTTQTPPVVDLGASQAFTPLVSFANTITPNHIGAAIDASEYARMFSSLVIALLVILSHLGFSSLGSSIVSFRPVFLLLLTDATIVLGRVLLSHCGEPSSASRRENSGQGIADQVGNALETVMMIKKIMDAISMDFSLYAVILISFTSHQENTSDALFDNVNHIIHQRRAESLQPHKYTETSAEASASTTLQQPSPATSTTQTPPVVDLGASQAFTPLVSFANTITPNHIGAAIDASEYARMFSSLVIALLVILSHLGFSSLGSSIVSFRPVFLLLLTDATIVLGRVLLSHRGAPSSASRRENSGQGIAAQVGNALETVMMIKKIMNAISMDFSLYAVILICGLLFTQNIFA
ncbi:hypothetical protein F2Q70_00034077 [Brassica cretica]|uniref:Uncharacterized protein n=1 Tax=Brassica cretica TaxID=69181 RepID=A0A8S9JS81_BRACR|nr:hypothetical protein F2Q70_00034077 [Brassica cretica]